MRLWTIWYSCVQKFQVACSRDRTFMYLVLVLAGFSLRMECAGVTSFIRALCLEPSLYYGFLHFFNYSTGLNLHVLSQIWCQLIRSRLPILRVGGYEVYVADGLKVAKEGKKMPGVKKLYQSSENNSKPSYFLGHSFQVIAALIRHASKHVVAIPLASRIHEGVRRSPNERGTLLDKLVELFHELLANTSTRALLVADAYYASGKVARPLTQNGHQLLTQVRSNAVAYKQPPDPKHSRRGRPKKYGEKVNLKHIFACTEKFQKAASPVYGETGIEIAYYTMDLLWRPLGRLVRYVWVKHPDRGRIILMCTDCTMDPLTIIEAYGYRFKIEVSFRSAIHQLGTYAYHFWMKAMKPTWKKGQTQYLHKESEQYRKAIERKMEAYHRFVQLGGIAQGLLIYLSLTCGGEVWKQFRSWLRTMDKTQPPSELVVSYALRTSLLEFLQDSPNDQKLKKILAENMRIQEIQDFQLAA